MKKILNCQKLLCLHFWENKFTQDDRDIQISLTTTKFNQNQRSRVKDSKSFLNPNEIRESAGSVRKLNTARKINPVKEIDIDAVHSADIKQTKKKIEKCELVLTDKEFKTIITPSKSGAYTHRQTLNIQTGELGNFYDDKHYNCKPLPILVLIIS